MFNLSALTTDDMENILLDVFKVLDELGDNDKKI